MTTLAPRLSSYPSDEVGLDAALSAPAPGVGEALAAVDGDIVLLGAGGKIGPTMALMARRALDEVGSTARVVAVSRFSDAAVREQLQDAGIVVQAADLADADSYADLPDAAAMFYLAAMKFGTTGQEHRTWWSNAAMPTMVANRYRGCAVGGLLDRQRLPADPARPRRLRGDGGAAAVG